jgi:hypothetical protein
MKVTDKDEAAFIAAVEKLGFPRVTALAAELLRRVSGADDQSPSELEWRACARGVGALGLPEREAHRRLLARAKRLRMQAVHIGHLARIAARDLETAAHHLGSVGVARERAAREQFEWCSAVLAGGVKTTTLGLLEATMHELDAAKAVLDSAWTGVVEHIEYMASQRELDGVLAEVQTLETMLNVPMLTARERAALDAALAARDWAGYTHQGLCSRSTQPNCPPNRIMLRSLSLNVAMAPATPSCTAGSAPKSRSGRVSASQPRPSSSAGTRRSSRSTWSGSSSMSKLPRSQAEKPSGRC